MTNDLPARQLSRLYGVNHFITSQVNPIVLWTLRDTDAEDTLFAKFWEIGTQAARQSMRATYPLSMKLTERSYPLNVFVRMAYGIATQKTISLVAMIAGAALVAGGVILIPPAAPEAGVKVALVPVVLPGGAGAALVGVLP